jgi:hypothetical protein
VPARPRAAPRRISPIAHFLCRRPVILLCAQCDCPNPSTKFYSYKY